VLIVTTTVTLTRPAADGDPYEAPTLTTTAAGVPAHISSPSGDDLKVGGDKEVITAVAYLPAGTDVVRTDRITDDNQGTAWEVSWLQARRGLGLDHVQVGLRVVSGGANG
jgi:hypothetical protein